MAGNMIANTFPTYSDNSLREDLTDVIWNVSPIECPFATGIAKTRATNTFHQWQRDSLAAASSSNANVEGDDITSFDAVTATVKLGNRTQILRKTLVISDSDESVIHAGLKSIIAYETAKKGRELRRDIEKTLLNNQAAVAAAASIAPTLAAVLSWIKTNSIKASDGSDPSAADGTATRTDGTVRTFTENLLKTALQNVFTNASDFPDLLLVPPALKQTVSTFSGNATRMMDAEAERVVAGITVYCSDFGDIKVVPDRFMRSTDALALNTDLWALAWLRPIRLVDLAKTGDATKKMIVAELALESRNEAGSAGIFDLTT